MCVDSSTPPNIMEAAEHGKLHPRPLEESELNHSTEPLQSIDNAKLFSLDIQSSGSPTDLNTDSKKWQSCCCFHVRKVTIVLCVLRLVGNIVLLYLLFYILINTDDRDDIYIPTREHHEGESSSNRIKNSIVYSLIAVIFIVTISTSMMVYGALKYKLKFMIPTLCIEAITFCILSVLLVIYVVILPNLELRPLLICIPVLTAGLKLTLHGYFFNVFWRCYNFCKLHHRMIPYGGFPTAELRAGQFQ